MNREKMIPYISHCLDDAMAIREIKDMPDNARLVVYQCGFEPMVIAVWSYLGCRLDADDAEDIAGIYLSEKKWFASDDTAADYVI